MPGLATASLWGSLPPAPTLPPWPPQSGPAVPRSRNAGFSLPSHWQPLPMRRVGLPGAGSGGVRARGRPAWQLWGGLVSQAPHHLSVPTPGASLTSDLHGELRGRGGNLAAWSSALPSPGTSSALEPRAGLSPPPRRAPRLPPPVCPSLLVRLSGKVCARGQRPQRHRREQGPPLPLPILGKEERACQERGRQQD